MSTIATWRARIGQLKHEVYALYLACRHPATPWYAKLLLAAIVAYALSPLDLIPDPIPLLGYLDDLLLLSLGIYLALKIIPEPVIAECRNKARLETETLPANLIAAGIIALVWVAAATAVVVYFWPFASSEAILTPEAGFPGVFVAKRSGRTVTKRPGWRNMILAIEGEIGLPNKQ
jgi:uncharacterized membrane protein YkvA (DUF1232 family)